MPSAVDSLNVACCILRYRLLCLKSFGPYYEQLDTSANATICIRDLCCSGFPMCYLFNLLPDDFFPKIDIDFGFAPTEEYSRNMAIALFAMNAKRTLECEHFTITELLRDDTAGLRKAVSALLAVLHLLPENSFEYQTAVTPPDFSLSSSPSRSSVSESPNITQFLDETIWKTRLRSILHSERQYVQDVEMLQDYSSGLFEHGSESAGNIVAHVFHKNFFTFVRKFYIQLECIVRTPLHEQRWGRLFIDNANNIQILYTIYCFNYVLAEESLREQDAKLRETGLHPLASETVSKLLNRPFQHLSEYVSALDRLITASDAQSPYHAELLSGRDAIKDAMAKVASSQKQAKTELIVKALKSRVSDWNDFGIDVGLFILKGNSLVRHNGAIPFYSEFYLFDKELIFFHERPTPSTPRIGKRKTSAASVMPPSSLMPLDLSSRIFTREIETVKVLLQNDGGSFSKAYANDIISSPSIYELVISTSDETLVLLFQKQDKAILWQSTIEKCRAESPSEVKRALTLEPSPSPSTVEQTTGTTTQFAAMSIDNRILVRLDLGNGDFLTVSVDAPPTYEELMERIWRKLKLCRRRTQVQYPRVSFRDADGREQVLTPRKDLASIFSRGPTTVLYVR